MVDAERSFAQTSKEKTTKETFATYMNDSGFIFRSGPIPGKKFKQDADQRFDLLTWEPVFAEFSSSGDLSYTTGQGNFIQRWGESSIGYRDQPSRPLSPEKKEYFMFSSKPTLTTRWPYKIIEW